MTWADFYLFCFLFGFFFSLVAVVTGHLHLDFHGHGHGADFGHGHAGVAHSGHGHSGHVHAGDGAHHGRVDLSPFNMGTIAAFLAWFGGTGFLATKFYGVWVVTSLVFAIASGVAGAGIVFWFLSKVLMREREEMDPALYEMVGVLGNVSSSIRSGGVGEILYLRDGARRAAPARSDNGNAIPNGVEVIVTRYENGIAYVRPWEDMA
jgi:hypothetical protein